MTTSSGVGGNRHRKKESGMNKGRGVLTGNLSALVFYELSPPVDLSEISAIRLIHAGELIA